MKKKTVWVFVTDDEYELPLAVADTAQQMAELTGYSRATIVSSYSHWRRGDYKTCRFRRVTIEV